MTSEDNLLTIRQAAKYLGVHSNTLRNWEKRRLIQSYRIGPRKDRRYSKLMLLQAVSNNRNGFYEN